MNKQQMKQAVIAAIDARREDILAISHQIYKNPETGYREFKTTELLADTLEKEGYEVERGITYTGTWVWTANVHEYYYQVAYEFYQDGVLVGELAAGEPVASEVISISLSPEAVKAYQGEEFELASEAAVYTNVDISASIDNAENATLITLRYERNTPPLPELYTVTISYYNDITGELLARVFEVYEAGSAYDHRAEARRSFEGLVRVRVEGPLTEDSIEADAYINVYYRDAYIPEEPSVEPEPPVNPPIEPPVEPPVEPEVEIPDEDVPLADVPNTGDTSMVSAAMSAASAFALGAIQFLSRRKRSRK